MRQFFETYRDEPKLSPAVREFYPDATTFFKDTYLFDFLQIPSDHTVLKDDTELFKQFMDNESFKRWMTDTVFGLTYDQPRAGAPGA
jgi:hypothetical protein